MPPESNPIQRVEALTPAEQARQRIKSGFDHVRLLMDSSSYSDTNSHFRHDVSEGTDLALARLILADQGYNSGNMKLANAAASGAEAEIAAVAKIIIDDKIRTRETMLKT